LLQKESNKKNLAKFHRSLVSTGHEATRQLDLRCVKIWNLCVSKGDVSNQQVTWRFGFFQISMWP